MDRKRKTTHLTNDAKQHFTAVRRLEEGPAVAALRSQAEAYREVRGPCHLVYCLLGCVLAQHADAHHKKCCRKEAKKVVRLVAKTKACRFGHVATALSSKCQSGAIFQCSSLILSVFSCSWR